MGYNWKDVNIRMIWKNNNLPGNPTNGGVEKLSKSNQDYQIEAE